MAVFGELSQHKPMLDPEERQVENLQRPETVERLKGRNTSVSVERFASTMNILTVMGVLAILVALGTLVFFALKLFTA